MKQFIIDQAADAVLALDLSGQITYYNDAFQSLTGYPGSQPGNSTYSALLGEEGALDFDRIRESILFGEYHELENLELTTQQGEKVKVVAQFSPIKQAEGRIVGISVFFRKVTVFEYAASKSQALLETAPDAMVIVSEIGQIVLVNAQVEKLFGYKRGELLGQPVEVLVPKEFLKNHKKHRDSYLHDPKTRSMGQNMELHAKRKDGTTFEVEISLSPLRIDRKLFVSAAIRDISARKKADKKFRDLLNSAPDAMVIVNESGIIQLVNRQVQHVFGYLPEELVGQPVEKLVPEHVRKLHPEHIRKFFSQPKTRSMGAGLQLLGARKNGDEFPVEISLSPLETEDGVLVSAAIRDITERKKAEDKFRGLLNSAPDAMVIVNESGIIQLVNRQVYNVFGYSPEELVGQPVEKLVPEHIRKLHPAHIRSFFSQPKTRAMGAGLQLLGARKNGEEFPVEISLSPLETEEGVLVSAAIRDITERKKAEDKFRGLLNSAPDAMVIVNETGVIQLVNRQVYNVFGYSPEELMGRPVEVLMPEHVRKLHPAHIRSFFSQPKTRSMGAGLQLLGARKNGEEFPVEISLSPLETGEGVLVSAAIRDITERVKVEKELRISNKLFAEINQNLERFAYTAAHDLKSPLNTAIALTSLIEMELKSQNNPVLDSHLVRLKQLYARTLKLVTGILEYSRTNFNFLLTEEIDLNQFCKEFIEEFSINDRMKFHVNTGMPRVYYNYVALRQIFSNLVNNAVKYNDKAVCEITIDFVHTIDHYEISITDNGPGIAVEHQQRVFDLFHNLDTKREDSYGIGLSIVKKLVTQSNGSIWIESEPKKGAKFTFTIERRADNSEGFKSMESSTG